ncbi:hypothetical protein [Nocardioides antri]|uniref:Uncharacterized protein n=1 Tax=Nocardioides antri TaxID=2607659 RepID=A0A5B1LYI1_9ACTN|nr:hypothetical protein [Nocardioides antri]KAA1425606.1 hypothetical protein F0U47_17605 [Nocardioides antri]
MTVVWAAIVLTVAAVALYTAFVSRTVDSATWPEDAPLQLRENRAHDQQINHIERLLSVEDTTAAHQVLREVTAQLLAMPVLAETRLDPAAAAFVVGPPPRSPDRYRRELAEALRRIEQL